MTNEPVSDRLSPPIQRELLAAEDAGWNELTSLVGRLTPPQIERAGYFPEGWSVKDLLAHVGTWLAEASVALEQIRNGTYVPGELDVDAMNERFLEAMRGLPLGAVQAQAWSARTRMLQEWDWLPDVTEDALMWIRKSGADHYAEHLPRLREWVAELTTGDGG
jgi:Mycothiol maleylpyruvate isomerase N-terminal domain